MLSIVSYVKGLFVWEIIKFQLLHNFHFFSYDAETNKDAKGLSSKKKQLTDAENGPPKKKKKM